MFRVLFAAVWFLVACGGETLASQIWGTDFGSRGTSHSAKQVDHATGDVLRIVTVPGDVYVQAVRDLASDPARTPGVIWSVHTGFLAGNVLVEFDPNRAKQLSVVAIDADETILSLAIDPLTGRFYGASSLNLYEIQPTTGVAQAIGATQADVSIGLGFGLDGVLYGIDSLQRLMTVDTTSGATTLVAELTGGTLTDLAARPEDGVLYGLGTNSQSYSLFTIDPATAEATWVGQSVGRNSGIAFTGVPEPGAVAIAAVAAVGMLGRFRGRRDRRPAALSFERRARRA
ncbi:hypothetical protein Mal64_25340 [Pseudobythopirellula maris]|uniref:PEP-CTERM protein-sorting domain-containing protein n=1 Tax=Pseudobythopirellula maris TaxID=2527991 RepID=A0A5C5ZS26_9BACT|nr:hypothetical protein [Pseudobythopirellula maris]TWT89043.1 hypothetical protein Mal64_25340 [Pseudobythopirellula maris]